MNYTKEQIDALIEELINMSMEELIEKTSTDEHFILEEYMNSYSY
jgi:hypothetical protein